MANEFYSEKDIVEVSDNYKPYKERSDKKSVIDINIELADGGGYLFPYAFKAVSEYKRRKNNDGSIAYTLTLVGGGKALLLHFENFSDEKFKRFLELLSEHKINKIFEYDGSITNIDSPVISAIEEIQPNV